MSSGKTLQPNPTFFAHIFADEDNAAGSGSKFTKLATRAIARAGL